MNGTQPFVYIATCGCVLTQTALKTVTKASATTTLLQKRIRTQAQMRDPMARTTAYSCARSAAVDSLVSLARNYNRIVVFTIHQPRSNIVALFDQLLVLASGKPVYSGEFSKCHGYLVHHLASVVLAGAPIDCCPEMVLMSPLHTYTVMCGLFFRHVT